MKKSILKWQNPNFSKPKKECVLLIQYWEYGGVSYKLGIFVDNIFYTCVFELGAIPKPMNCKNILYWAYLPEVTHA